MTRLSRALTAPLRLATGTRRAACRGWPRLPRPTVSVGNLALGGRGKTPLVAALAAHAIADGARPAVLLRGYPRVSRRADPHVLVRPGTPAPPWTVVLDDGTITARSSTHARTCGDEAAWLAAVTGAPVGVHPDRVAGAAAVLQRHPEVDLFLLDDGLQAPIRPDLEIVLVDPTRDLADSPHPVATREGEGGLPAGAWILRLGTDLQRRPGALWRLDGVALAPAALGPVTVCAGVGDPASVGRVARELGLSVRGSIAVRDHRAPTARQLAAAPGPLLITEKDAVGWAAALPLPDCAVLELRLAGTEAIWERSRALLGSLA